MAVLVTGGAGFIGSHVAEALIERGEEIVIIDDFNDFYSPELKKRNLEAVRESGQCQIVTGDIVDSESIAALPWEDIDRVIHLAARAGVRPSLSQPALYYRTNVEGTLNLLQAACTNGVEKFIFASSSSVYGNSEQVPFVESDPVSHPISPYAATKKASELMAFTFHHLHGLNISCLRYFTVYGPRQRPEMAIHKFTRLIDSGQPVPLYGSGESARDYTYISDIVSGTLAALDHCKGYAIYNIGGSQTTRLGDLVDMIGNALGKEPEISRQDAQPGDVRITHADVSLAKRDFGYAPKVPINKGIAEFVLWYRNTIRES